MNVAVVRCLPAGLAVSYKLTASSRTQSKPSCVSAYPTWVAKTTLGHPKAGLALLTVHE